MPPSAQEATVSLLRCRKAVSDDPFSRESAAWERLQDGPLDVEHPSNEDRALTRALARLVRDGIAIYSGFTPTDAAHVLGIAGLWSSRAAVLAAIVWARQMRQVYGWGKFEDNDPKGPSSAVEEHMVRTICAALVSACLATDPGKTHHGERERTARLFSEWISGHSAVDGDLFSLKLDDSRSLVVVGAPAELYYPDVLRTSTCPFPFQITRCCKRRGRCGEQCYSKRRLRHPAGAGYFRVFASDGPITLTNWNRRL